MPDRGVCALLLTAAHMYPGKRALDILLTTFLAPLWLPLFAAVACVVRVTLGTPVLFRQHRIGLANEPFTLLKFRTMNNATDANGAPLPDDVRLTGVGKFLRATSLDELPELFNVLAGNMSLVGPRPLLPEYLPLYSPRHVRRHEARPGITGLAQVSGRNGLSWPDRFEYDVEYVDRQSLVGDIKILSRTLGTVLFRKNISAPGMSTMSKFTGYDAPSTHSTARQ